MHTSVLKRVVRRELHSPRTTATVVLLCVGSVLAVFAGIDIVRWLVGAPPLLWAPTTALNWAANLPAETPTAAVIAGAVVVAVCGAALLWFACAAGHRSRHSLGAASHAVVVDNGVIAASIATSVREALELGPNAVRVGVGHRSADITVHPEPERRITRQELTELTGSQLATYQLTPKLRVHARTVESGGNT